MELDLVKLRTLISVRHAGSMTAAAARLGYTPGAVSQQMAALERSVGVPLFEPVGRGVRLTDKAEVLADYAQRFLRLAADTERALGELDEHPRSTVTIGVFGTSAGVLLPAAVKQLRKTAPGVALRSVEVDVDAATAAVAAGTVDVAFGIDYPQTPIPRDPAVRMTVLATERFAIGVPAGHARAGTRIRLRDLADASWILPPEDTFYGRAVRAACRRADYEPRGEHVVTDTASTLALVAAGLGVAPVTGLMLSLRSRGLSTASLRDRLERTVVLAHRADPAPQPGVAAVIEAIAAAMTG